MFLAIPVDDRAAASIARTVDRIPLPESDFRRSRRDDWHITLQFLGNVSSAQLECLLPCLSAISAPPQPIRIAGMEWLGQKILTARVHPSDGLRRLVENVTAATGRCGFQSEDRPWRPHITLARSKGRGHRVASGRVRALPEKTLGTSSLEEKFVAREFLLYESTLTPQGAHYTVRARYALDERERR